MVFTDEMKDSYLLVEKDLADLKAIGSTKLQARLDHLEADVQAFMDAAAEAMDVWEAEELSAYEIFDLHYRRLAGLAEELCALGQKRPESVCNRFKIRQVNAVLEPLKEELEKAFHQELSLIAEEEGHTYSDVALVLRGYLDLCTFYAKKRYGTNYHEKRR